MGATPVPGPIQISGISLSEGNNKVPFEKSTFKESPVTRDAIQFVHTPTLGSFMLVL